MPRGLFLLKIDAKGNGQLIAKHFVNEEEEIPIGSNEILKIRMQHDNKAIASTVYPDYFFLTHLKEYLLEKKTHQFVTGAVLEPTENHLKYRDALQFVATNLFEKRDSAQEELEEELEEAFANRFRDPRTSFNIEGLEQKLKNKAKALTREGELDAANEIIEKIKKYPRKLRKINDRAENYLEKQSYEKAVKKYEQGLELAEELKEQELVQLYKEKIKLVNQIPELINKKESLVDQAVDALRNEKWEQSSRLFDKASTVCDELSDGAGSEEYGLKAKALAEYVNAERKFRK